MKNPNKKTSLFKHCCAPDIPKYLLITKQLEMLDKYNKHSSKYTADFVRKQVKICHTTRQFF